MHEILLNFLCFFFSLALPMLPSFSTHHLTCFSTYRRVLGWCRLLSRLAAPAIPGVFLKRSRRSAGASHSPISRCARRRGCGDDSLAQQGSNGCNLNHWPDSEDERIVRSYIHILLINHTWMATHWANEAWGKRDGQVGIHMDTIVHCVFVHHEPR